MNDIYDEMVKQSQDVSPQNFRCSTCVYYDGRLICRLGTFIAFDGANMSHCSRYRLGKGCPNCGKMVEVH